MHFKNRNSKNKKKKKRKSKMWLLDGVQWLFKVVQRNFTTVFTVVMGLYVCRWAYDRYQRMTNEEQIVNRNDDDDRDHQVRKQHDYNKRSEEINKESTPVTRVPESPVKEIIQEKEEQISTNIFKVMGNTFSKSISIEVCLHTKKKIK